jgi:hypothetical protein
MLWVSDLLYVPVFANCTLHNPDIVKGEPDAAVQFHPLRPPRDYAPSAVSSLYDPGQEPDSLDFTIYMDQVSDLSYLPPHFNSNHRFLGTPHGSCALATRGCPANVYQAWSAIYRSHEHQRILYARFASRRIDADHINL